MKILKYSKVLTVTFLTFTFAACQNDPLKDLTVADTQVFITNHNEAIDFQQFKTFSIVDSVQIYGNQVNTASLSPNDVLFLNNVVQQMQDLGYQYVSPKDNPDVGVNVAQVRNTYLNVVSRPISPGYGSYWGGYGGYGYGYPSSYSYYQTQENYWVLEMLDLKNPDTQNKKLNVVWNASIKGEGLFDGIDTQNIVQSVFAQSTYLKIK